MIPRTAAVRSVLLTVALVWATACLDSAGPVRHVDPLPDSVPDSPLGLIVSSPVAGSADTGAASTLSSTAQVSGPLVYVSVAAGTVPSGLRATIRDGAMVRSLREVAVVDGGFDPVAIPATIGDTLLVQIERVGNTSLRLSTVVRPKRPPAVVRSSPPRGGRDVPLNAAIIVVFSEPVDGGTVTPTSVQLLRGATPVEGTVRLLDPSGLFVLFEPAQLLAPATSYRLAVAQTVRDRDGDALDAPVAIDFTTGNALTGEAATVTVFPDLIEEFFPVTMTITAYVGDARGNVLLDPTVQWASSDTSVAVVHAFWGQASGREAWVTLHAGGVAIITATSGGLSDTLLVRSLPVPGETYGSLGVTTATTGADFDPRGYTFIVAGAGYQRTWWTSANGSATLPAVPVGDYSVTLGDPGPTCAVIGANTQTVTITAGATSEVAFAVDCSSAVNGSVRVKTVTTGEGFDRDGYGVRVPWDPWGEAVWAPANGSIVLPAVAAGQRGFSLLFVASNCAVVGGESNTVTVTAGDTSDLTFAVTCAADLPSLRLTITTTGTDVDPDGYRLDVIGLACGWEPWQCGQVPVNGSFTYSGLTPSGGGEGYPSYVVQVSGVAANCAVIGANPRTVSVVRGTTAELSFAITCAKLE